MTIRNNIQPSAKYLSLLGVVKSPIVALCLVGGFLKLRL